MFYCVMGMFNNLYAKGKANYKMTKRMGANIEEFDRRLNNTKKIFYLKSFHYNGYLIRDVLSSETSGVLLFYKHHSVPGNQSFIKNFINFINKVIAG